MTDADGKIDWRIMVEDWERSANEYARPAATLAFPVRQ